jgi:hypothetical protein
MESQMELELNEIAFWKQVYVAAVAAGQAYPAGVADDAVTTMKNRCDGGGKPAEGHVQRPLAELVEGVPVVRGFVSELRTDYQDPRTRSGGKVSIECMFDRGGKTRMEFALGPAVDVIYELANAGEMVGVELRFELRFVRRG